MYFTYIDWTLEEHPRPFYVGKGTKIRTRNPKRNNKHCHVSHTHGYRRDITFSSDDENACLTREIELIAEHHTYIHDPRASEIACNFTVGGEGASGYKQTQNHIEKRMKAHKRVKRNTEICANISSSKKGKSIKKQMTKRRSPNLSEKRLEQMRHQIIARNKSLIKLDINDSLIIKNYVMMV